MQVIFQEGNPHHMKVIKLSLVPYNLNFYVHGAFYLLCFTPSLTLTKAPCYLLCTGANIRKKYHCKLQSLFDRRFKSTCLS